MKKIALRGGTVITMNASRAILKTDILIEGDTIVKIGKLKPADIRGATVMDATDRIIGPGFIQTHIHLCQTLFRNLADDLELLDWLKLKIWPFEAAHNPQSIALSARMGIEELIRCGTTTIMDMGTVHHTDYIFEAIQQSGLRALCGKAMMDECRGAPKGLNESQAWSISESMRLKRDWHKTSNGRIQFAFAPRFVLSCSESLLCDVRDLSRENGLIIHTHSSENRGELAAVIEKCGMSNVEYFHHIKMTGEKLCLAHGIWLNDREFGIVRETKTKIMHCPSSNLKLGSGVAKVPEMLNQGIDVSLGADGAPCNNNLDIFQEMRLAALLQKPRLGPTCISAEQVYEMATRGGARALNLQDEVGSIEVGKKADIIVMDLRESQSQPYENLYSQIVYSAHAACVQTVIIDGKVIMRDREMKTLERTSFTEIGQEIKKLLRRVG